MPAGPHAEPAGAVLARLDADPATGLSAAEAARRLEAFGPNRPEEPRPPGYLRIAVVQLLDPLVALLLAAAAVAAATGDTVEAAVIGAIVVLNAVLGFWHESRAEQAMRALAEGFGLHALVVRDGRELTVAAADVVPGDVLLVGEGDRVAADARIVEARGVEADESALTGESLPVAKSSEPAGAAAPLAERASMLHAGTSVTRGRARAVVCATGASSELGRIAGLTGAAAPPLTPLVLRMGRLARQMALGGAAITVLVGAMMLLRGHSLHAAFLTGVALAVAAVPEGLAATVTAALALGARAMARRGAIVRRLAAIETLGETTVICTDKTGTLTQNRIAVAELLPATGYEHAAVLDAAVRASNPPHGADGDVGDPLELALHRERDAPPPSGRAVHEIPFDADRRRMTRVWEHEDGRRAYTKGAPEVVAERVGAPDHPLVQEAERRAARGARVLAIARRDLGERTALDADVDAGGELVGLVSFADPLRPTSADAVAAAGRAGIEVRMVTGDHPAAARSIGRAVGLEPDAVLARATPQEKLELVTRLQDAGEVVAVTGDGVNDAPALRRADVGVAMGRSGTEAARQAASIVLTDDDFATIVAAIAEGRRIGDNIRRFVTFILSSNLGEVVAFVAAIAAGAGAPLTVVQILIVNLLTDGLPAVALAQDPPHAQTMTTPPRRETDLLGRHGWRRLMVVGGAVGLATLGAYAVGHRHGDGVAQTMAFATLAVAELGLVFAFRAEGGPLWPQPRNRWLVRSVLASLAVVAAAVYVPGAHDPLGTVSLQAGQAALVLAFACVPFAVAAALRGRGVSEPSGSGSTGCRSPVGRVGAVRPTR